VLLYKVAQEASRPYLAMCCRVLQCSAVCCSVLQCVAVCGSVLQCVAYIYIYVYIYIFIYIYVYIYWHTLDSQYRMAKEANCPDLAVCCSVLQCVAVRYSAVQCGVVWCSRVVQCVAK